MSTPQDQDDKVDATKDTTVSTIAENPSVECSDVGGGDDKIQEEEFSKSTVETKIVSDGPGTDNEVEDINTKSDEVVVDNSDKSFENIGDVDYNKTVDNESGVRDVDTEETNQGEINADIDAQDNIEKIEGEMNVDLKENDTPQESELGEKTAEGNEQDLKNNNDVSVDPNIRETEEEINSEDSENGTAKVPGKADPEEAKDKVLSPSDEKEDAAILSPVPNNDTFTEGELPDSPLPQPVGERLSRESTPGIDNASPKHNALELVPGTPELEGKEASGIESVQVEAVEGSPEPQFDRDVLIEKYNVALAEREQLKQRNYQLQHKLAEYFRKKKSDDRTDYDKNVTDQEQRYLKYMDQLQELQKQAKREEENYKLQITDLTEKSKEKKDRVDEEKRKFTHFKIQVATNSLNSRSGKPIPQKDIDMYIQNEEKKEQEVTSVRLENIKSKNKLKKKEQQLKSKEELAEGLHLIDFEQLKIENQTYNEKIEERNEELLKLRKKITSTVQVLTHLKEKLQFVQAENHVQKKNLQDVESLVGQKRDILSRTKQARDSLRIDNHKLRQNCGLLGNVPLLRDFEERKDESDQLKTKLEQLQSLHAELALNCNQVRRKIEQTRMGHP